jgi:hypothetical protein
MDRMFKPIAALCAITLVTGASVASAQSAPQPAITPGTPEVHPKHKGTTSNESGTSLPQGGDVELLLEAPPIVNSTNLTPGTTTRGLGVSSSMQAGGETYLGLGLNAGVGYYVTDLFEIGGAIALDYGQCLAGGTNYGNTCNNGGYFEALAEPFVKLNFGRLLQGAHFNPFAQVGIMVGGESGPGVGTGLLGFDLDLGVDFLVSRGWGIAVFIPFSLLAPLASNAAVPTVFGFGFGYGLVTYF